MAGYPLLASIPVFEQLFDTALPIAQIVSGGGLRLIEGVCLRVKDIDFEQKIPRIRGKAAKERRTIMIETALEPLKTHLASARKRHGPALHPGSVEPCQRPDHDERYPCGT
jgi:site-specific recombinase XerC